MNIGNYNITVYTIINNFFNNYLFNLFIDNIIYIPVNKIIKLNITSTDVIHSFFLPEIIFKLDAIPW